MRFLIWTFVFGVLLTFGVVLFRLFARTIGAAAVASLIALVFALAFAGGPFEFIGVAALAWLPAFVAAFFVMTRAGRRRDRMPSALDQPVPAPEHDSIPLAPEDRRRHAAWSALARAKGGDAARVAAARTACERFLRLAADSGLIVETESLVIRIRNHVPAHIEAALAHADDAAPDERRALIDGALDTVERVAADADRLRNDIRRRQATELEVQRRHLEGGL